MKEMPDYIYQLSPEARGREMRAFWLREAYDDQMAKITLPLRTFWQRLWDDIRGVYRA